MGNRESNYDSGDDFEKIQRSTRSDLGDTGPSKGELEETLRSYQDQSQDSYESGLSTIESDAKKVNISTRQPDNSRSLNMFNSYVFEIDRRYRQKERDFGLMYYVFIDKALHQNRL